jgi:hypothetical protein
MTLELHHTTYTYWAGMEGDWGNACAIFGRETPDDLLALCRDCHKAKHIGPDGGFYGDPEECAAERDYYDHMATKDD